MTFFHMLEPSAFDESTSSIRSVQSEVDDYDALDDAFWWDHGYRHLPDHLRIVPGDRVLDVGCRTGKSARWLAAAHSAQVLGTDPSPAMIRTAEERPTPGVRYRRTPRGSLPGIPDSSADATYAGFVVSCEFLDHLVEELFSEVLRVLRPGSRFTVLDSNPSAVGIHFPGVVYGPPGRSPRPGEVVPLSLQRRDGTWTRSRRLHRPLGSVRGMLESAGFTVDRMDVPLVRTLAQSSSQPAVHAPFYLITGLT
ncbi:class I SAM-dependent methyltransferase [Saccharopolyspora gregorii]|uniref:Methyltransferase type 11 domain-containing protein n=1 Tax=Saccharopolyspora gregorii TaxID=33914 RepID=A0ABP6RXX4_9PSEU|nr:methyltransferase domain-containing protein [Saccharopolyspora gregorii]